MHFKFCYVFVFGATKMLYTNFLKKYLTKLQFEVSFWENKKHLYQWLARSKFSSH